MALIDSIFGPAAGALAGFGGSRFARATDGRTNPNAKPAKKGKNAKSTKSRDRAMAQEGEANRQFLQQNIFDRTGATRRTMSGQIEKNVPQGLDFFKNTGPDRPEVQQRQQRLDAGAMSNPNIWNQAQQAVNDRKAQQGWATPNTPPSTQQGDLNSLLRQSTPGVGVFENPAFNQTNPRTGLTINDGPFTRAMTGPFGSGSAVMTPQPQMQKPMLGQSLSMVPQLPSGPVDMVFGQMPNTDTAPSPMFNVPQQPMGEYERKQLTEGPDYIPSLDMIMSMLFNQQNTQNNAQKNTQNNKPMFQFESF